MSPLSCLTDPFIIFPFHKMHQKVAGRYVGEPNTDMPAVSASCMAGRVLAVPVQAGDAVVLLQNRYTS